jgi:hypothetical protein
MRIGSLVKHKKQDVVGLVTKVYHNFEICYVKWPCNTLERIKMHRIEVIHE